MKEQNRTVRWIKSKVAIKSKSTRHPFSLDGFSLHFVSLLLFHVGVAVHHPPPNVRRWSQSIVQVTNDVILTAPHITIRLHVSSPSLHRMTHSLGQLAPPPSSSQSPFDHQKRSHLTSNCTIARRPCWALHHQPRPRVSHLRSPRSWLRFLQQPQISPWWLLVYMDSGLSEMMRTAVAHPV